MAKTNEILIPIGGYVLSDGTFETPPEQIPHLNAVTCYGKETCDCRIPCVWGCDCEFREICECTWETESDAKNSEVIRKDL